MIAHGVGRALVKGRGGGPRLRPVAVCRGVATQLVKTDTTLPELGLHLRKGFASTEEVACLQRLADSAFVGVDYASTHTDDLITKYRETAVNLNDGSIEDDRDARKRREGAVAISIHSIDRHLWRRRD